MNAQRLGFRIPEIIAHTRHCKWWLPTKGAMIELAVHGRPVDELVGDPSVPEEQKQEAVDNMIAMTDIAEKETAAEILLESKGFEDVVVSITDNTVDVVVSAAELTEAERAQIEDIVIRKTGIAPENIVISTLADQ
mgnify:CR=1 FL=1